MAEAPKFPLVEANLTLPPEGEHGELAVCTNTSAAGQVLNEIGMNNREHVAVMGSLIANMSGAERMMLNAMVHPNVRRIVLFGNETASFWPSTNILKAVMHGIDEETDDHKIVGGVGPSPIYPNLSGDVVGQFRDTVQVLPFYVSRFKSSVDVVEEYLDWLGDGVSPAVAEMIDKNAGLSKIYYDALNELLEALADQPPSHKFVAELDPKDFQRLQPPVIRLETKQAEKPEVPFCVSTQNGVITTAIQTSIGAIEVTGNDEFEIAYTIMKQLGDAKDDLTPEQQLLLGAELGRVGIQMRNNIETTPFTNHAQIEGQPVDIQRSRGLKMDEKYYYEVGVVDGDISVKCMAKELCEDVFDIRSSDLVSVIAELVELGRFDDYEMDILHRLDVGTQIARADIARQHGFNFLQDFPPIFQENTSELPLRIIESDTFLDAHSKLLQTTFVEGLTEPHADFERKGTARSMVALLCLRGVARALEEVPVIYRTGNSKVSREDYCEQLLRRDHDGDYSYGHRTRTHFEVDQLEKAVNTLKHSPNVATVVQRYDPTEDMGMEVDPETGKREFTHDPCLTHDIYWMQDGKLQSLHIARAHNFVGAYPSNIYGLYDAYVRTVSDELGVENGDMFVLSSRGNILLLTEEDDAKKIIMEPTKPYEQTGDNETGPNYISSEHQAGITYTESEFTSGRLDHDLLYRLKAGWGVDTIEKMINYHEIRGGNHNNTVLTEFSPEIDDPQASQLVFCQTNVYAGKVYATAVFANRDPSRKERDLATISSIANELAARLGVGQGKIHMFYVGSQDV